MYVTRRLSHLLKSPETLAAKTEGPNSGYLVIQDRESETYSCFGYFKNLTLGELPFPQDKELIVRYTTYTPIGTNVSLYPLLLIPVLNQPLSSNRYYAIVPHGKHKGEAYTCSTEEDKVTVTYCFCCESRDIKDVEPRPLDPHNVYQQFEIVPCQEDCSSNSIFFALCSTKGTFFATSTAEDGFPPCFLQGKGWDMCTKTLNNLRLGEAKGIDNKLRARLPQQIRTYEPLVVGKWYSPFIFINEGTTLKDQVKRSMYYEITLEQRWEKVFACNSYEGKSVKIDVVVEREEVFVGGSKAVWNEKSAVDGVIWFTSYGPTCEKTSVGLRAEIVERMKWEQMRGGFVGGEERQVNIKKEFKKVGGCSEFGCYVLVERFNVKRMDGSLILSYDFKHLHQMKTKWE